MPTKGKSKASFIIGLSTILILSGLVSALLFKDESNIAYGQIPIPAETSEDAKATINEEYSNDNFNISQNEYNELLGIINSNKVDQIQIEKNILDKLTENFKNSLSKSFKYNQDQTIEEIKIGGDMDIGGDLTVNEYRFPSKDGKKNQVLKTDGKGQLRWSSDNTGGGSQIGDALTLEDLTVNSSLIVNGTISFGDYSLPTTDGSANQVLKTNGSGVLSWQDDNSSGGIGTSLSLEDLTISNSFTLGDYEFPLTDGVANQVLKTDGDGNLTWQSDNSATFETTVGPTGSGADYITDGNSDDVQIQAAITAVTSSGGGVIKIFAGTYDIRNTILVPKDPKIKIEGEYITKSGYGGTVLKVNSGLGSNLEAIIKEAGNAVANSSNADHSHASQYSTLVFDGTNKSDAGLLLLNTDHTMVNDSKFVNVTIGIDGQFNGDVSLADYAGGLRVERSSFLASNINIRLNSHTQDWITDSWFLGSPNTHIQFISSNKIHLSNNEFNTVDNQIFVFDDTASLHCGDINITGGFMDAGSGKNFWVDNRTNINSKGIIVAGVRMVTGTKTKFFNQAKEFQINTYTNANLSGGYIYPNFEDDVILLNASGATLPVQLPAASTAIKRILLKAINLTNGVTIYPDGSDSIEKDGSLTSSYAFSEVNESVWLAPDSDKWRVLSADKPSGGTSSGSAIENVIEVSSSTYSIPVDKDIILVNAFSNSVTLTLPLKADKYAENRKNIVVKVISAVNPVVINAAGADQIDNSGQTSVTINDLRAVTFLANSGSRWRTYSSQIVAGSDKYIQFNSSGNLGASANFVWDNSNNRVGILASSPTSSLDLGGSFAVKRTAVSTSTSSGAQVILGVTSTSAPRTINLRTADMVAGRIYIIKDESGGANINNITVATEGTEQIDGQDTYVINTAYGAVTLYSNAANWFIISAK